MNYTLGLAVAVSFLLLLLGIFPGVLGDLFLLAILTSCLWLPALVIGGGCLLFPLSRGLGKMTKPGDGPHDEFAGVTEPHVTYRRWMGLLIAILILNLMLFATGVPRRLAFAISRPAFESLLAKAPTTAYQGVALNRQLGIYHVDRFATDPRGGVYFRSYKGADGLGPDTMSYGFAFSPNPVGTPFGRAGYGYSHLFGNWYSFNASNDY
jgi:hypothetical protein